MNSSKSSLPSVTQFPPINIKERLSGNEWNSCLDVLNSILKIYLLSPLEELERETTVIKSITLFLLSYVSVTATDEKSRHESRAGKARELHQNVFMLTHRVFLQLKHPPDELLDWKFLADFSSVYPKSDSVRELLKSVWSAHESRLQNSLKEPKSQLIGLLGSLKAIDESSVETDILRRLLPLAHSSPDAAAFLITGSDLLDSISTAYPKVDARLQSKLVIFTFLCLSALWHDSTTNYAMLLDHLYALKENSSTQRSPSLLESLLVNTSILPRIQNDITGHFAARARTLAASLEPFRQGQHRLRPAKPTTRHKAIDKGKSKISSDETSSAEGVHVHRIGLVSQIQDLFPDLGAGFIVKLLDEYGDDAENVIANLLEDSLPPHLRDLDRSEALLMPSINENPISHLPPPAHIESSPQIKGPLPVHIPLDRKTVRASQLHIGHRSSNMELAPEDRLSQKSAILAALSTFDADDDERDDTYDVADVGGTVDNTVSMDDGERHTPYGSNTKNNVNPIGETDMMLFAAWRANPAVFERDPTTRRSKERLALKSETKQTDEALEGWAVMLKREPRRLKALKDRLTFGDNSERLGTRENSAVGRTTRRLGDDDIEDDDDTDNAGTTESGNSGNFHGRGSYSSRGGGGRGRARGGNVAGPSDEKGTQASRQRKEANKGSRANHNRRDQRARKMARGGFPG